MSKASPKSKSQQIIDNLYKIAPKANLFHTPEHEAFASITVNGHEESFLVLSDDFKNWLICSHMNKHGFAPYKHTLVDFIEQCKAFAIHDGRQEPVYTRIARIEDTVYIDLGNKERSVIKGHK